MKCLRSRDSFEEVEGPKNIETLSVMNFLFLFKDDPYLYDGRRLAYATISK